MKNEPIVRRSPDERVEGKTDWDQVDSLTDEEIEAAVARDPDAAPLFDEAFFRTAELVVPGSETTSVTLSLDREVVALFKKEGVDYRARMHAVLKAYALTRLRPRHESP